MKKNDPAAHRDVARSFVITDDHELSFFLLVPTWGLLFFVRVVVRLQLCDHCVFLWHEVDENAAAHFR